MTAAQDAEFAAYFTARRDHARRIAYLLTSDWHKADDLAQIAFVKLYGAWGRIRDHRALDAYLRSCLVRSVVDESRRPWRRERTLEVLPENPDLDASDIAGLVSDRELLRQGLALIPPGQRAVLVLRYFEGLDVAAAAAALGCSEGNVKSQTARGLAALRSAIQGLGIAGPGQYGGDQQ